MDNQDKILNEIKSIKTLLAKVVGTSELPQKLQFSKTAIDKVAVEFQKLSIQRGEWIEGSDIKKIIRHAPYNPSKFLINELKFINYFKRGNNLYFNKKDIVELGKELKERGVNLERYIEYKEDQAKFEKYIEQIINNPAKLPYQLPEDARDISTSNPPRPSVKLIREDLDRLKKEFIQFNLTEYIDTYNDTYAMHKNYYRFRNFVDKELKKRVSKWIDDFNTANALIQEFGHKKKKANT